MLEMDIMRTFAKDIGNSCASAKTKIFVCGKHKWRHYGKVQTQPVHSLRRTLRRRRHTPDTETPASVADLVPVAPLM